MSAILNVNEVEKIVYKLCYDTNLCIDKSIYNKILTAYNNAQNKNTKCRLKNILQNARIAYETKTPLCQDTGQVIVFLEIGENTQIINGNLEDGINQAVKKCYQDNFFRKSVVKNSVFDRTNTNDNTSAIVHTEFIKGNQTKITVLIKGAGSENKSKLKMMLPTCSKKDIKEYVVNEILSTGESACPPMFVGIGAGGTMEKAAILSKKALFNTSFSKEERQFADEIKEEINKKAPIGLENCYVLGVNILSSSTHIASMPIAITVNCHSLREASCTIENGKVQYMLQKPDFVVFDNEESELKEVFTDDINTIKSLNIDEEVLLTGEIYVARDEAHKRMFEMAQRNENLPFEPKDKIIFYAGPSPTKPNEIIGAIGPTTAGRMDKYATWLYNLGLLATIGKGERSQAVKDNIEKTGSVYFSAQGGIAALLKNCVTQSNVIAFEELGAEAILKLQVKKLPVKVALT